MESKRIYKKVPIKDKKGERQIPVPLIDADKRNAPNMHPQKIKKNNLFNEI